MASSRDNIHLCSLKGSFLFNLVEQKELLVCCCLDLLVFCVIVWFHVIGIVKDYFGFKVAQ